MAAGLGFKTFTTGEVLTSADTNGYLMQGVLVFASAAARDAAITSPQEGQFAYLKDTNVTTYYTGSAWANLDTTGMTNPMTTTGDMVYSSSGSTPARLGIGTTGQVVTVAGGIPSWATPSGGQVPILTKAVMGADFTTSSASYVDITGMTITRTPVSATNNIQIIATMDITPGADRITRFRLVYGATNSNIIGEYLLAKGGYQSTLTIVFNVTNVAATSTVFKMQMLTDGSTTVSGNTSGFLNSFSVLEVY